MPLRSPLARYALALALLLVVSRLPLLLEPRPVDDEAVYVVVGNEIAAGGRIYVSAVERKPPGLLWLYAAMSSAFGPDNAVALHLVATVWVLATMAGVFLIVRRLFDPETGLAAAMLYGLYQQWFFWNNLAFNGEVIMNLPIVWAYALLFARGGTRRRLPLLVSGMLLGAACMMKQPAAVAAVPAVLYLWHPDVRAGAPGLREPLMRSACIVSGWWLVLLVVAAVLQARGVLADAWYWTVADHDMPHLFWQNGLAVTFAFVTMCAPITLGAWWSIRQGAIWRGREGERFALVALVALSAVGTAASLRFYPHYFSQIVLPLAMLAAPALVNVWRLRTGVSNPRTAARALSGFLVVSFVAFLVSGSIGLSHVPDDTATGRYLREHAAPGDRIFVWGRGTRVYLDARRRPASRYIATFPLTGRIFGAPALHVDTTARILPDAWNHLQEDFRAHPPAYIVDMEVGPRADYPMDRFPMLRDRVAAHYEAVWREPGSIVYKYKYR
jgi:4-amino-4-deoxy-L-arabinose transferase-like glycosyltransferase